MKKTVAIGIITCRRPVGLERLLESLAAQTLSDENAARFVWYVQVVDNDLTGENEKVVNRVREKTGMSVRFTTEETPGIPAARNKSVTATVDADALIFVDDDEQAPPGWLDAMLTMWHETNNNGGDIITGPVRALLPDDAPAWAVKSNIFALNIARPRGDLRSEAYTNNTLVARHVLDALGPSFDMRFQYTGSSDTHYFMRAHAQGFKILWCPEAVIEEHVPHSRLSFWWQLKRGFRAGSGETMIAFCLAPNQRARVVVNVILRALKRGSFGLLQVVAGPVAGWRIFMQGSRRCASALGAIAGLAGLKHQEYKRIHGA